jgi:hypothetical protein
MIKQSFAAVFVVALASAAAPARADLQWSDNSFHVAYGSAYREPVNPENISKTILSYTHVDGYKWGSQFLNLDFLYSTSGEGDNVQGSGIPTVFSGTVPSAGALEVYAVYRNTLSLNKLTSSKKFELGGLVRDVGIVVGVDANTKNHAFSARKIMPVAGVALALNVPGFLNLELLANKEWGVNGIVGRSTSFDVTPMIAASWGIPLYGPVSFEGFGDVNLPKGTGGPGFFYAPSPAGSGKPFDTVTEVLVHPKLMVDVGTFFGSKGYQVGVGYEFWLNKFGNDHNQDFTGGSFARTVFGEVAIHL